MTAKNFWIDRIVSACRPAGVVALALLGLGALAQTASAATAFEHAGSFAETGPDGTLHHNNRIAVEHSTGRVFKTDPVGDRIVVYEQNGAGADELTAFGAGELSDPYGIAIDQSSGDVYVSDAGNGRVVRYSTDGLPVPTYARDAGYSGPAAGTGSGEVGDFRAAIALDPSTGELLLGDPGDDLVQRYASDGSYDGLSFDGMGSSATFTGLQDLAVASTGDVIVVDSAGGDPADDGVDSRVERFSSAGAWESTIGPVYHAANVAIRPATDEVVVSGNQDAVNRDQYPTVTVFDATTQRAVTLPASTQYSTVSGIAIDDGPVGRLFVATDTSRGSYPMGYGLASIQSFEVAPPAAPLVDPSGYAVTDVTPHAAMLHAAVTPSYAETTYHFEYGTTPAYGSSTTSQSVGDGGIPVAVDQAIEDLDYGTTYYYRVVAENSLGTTAGPQQTFQTAIPAPLAVSAAASNVTETSATLHGSAELFTAAGTAQFSVYTDSSPDSRTLALDPIPAGPAGEVPLSAEVDGLEPGTTYRYRVGITTASGMGFGDEVVFTTAGTPEAEKQVGTPPSDGSSYGCATSRLTRRVGSARPGAPLTLAGTGLGVYGAATVGGRPAEVLDWSPTEVRIQVPAATRGTVPVTVGCGDASATLRVAIGSAPLGRLTLGSRTSGGSVALTVRVPAAGRLVVAGGRLKSTVLRTAGARTVRLVLRLNPAGGRALAASQYGRLRVKAQIRFRAAGGATRSIKTSVAFKQKGGSR